MGPKAGCWASWLGFELQGWVLGFKVGTWSSRLEFGLQGRDLGLKGGDFGLEARGEMDRWTEEEEEENLVEFGKIRQNLAKFIKNLAKLGRIWQN